MTKTIREINTGSYRYCQAGWKNVLESLRKAAAIDQSIATVASIRYRYLH